MAEKSVAGGVVPPYGIAIGNALSKGSASIDELLALRDHARDIVGAQGDLVAALKALDAEIASHGLSAKAAPPAEERFIAQIEGLTIPAGAKKDIEQAIQQAVMAELAKLDMAGDLVVTPLSQAKLQPFTTPAFPWPVMGLMVNTSLPRRRAE
jgi:hypothetical protein